MRKKIIFGSIVVLLLVLIGIFLFSGRENVKLPKEDETTPVGLTKEELTSIQEQFDNEAFGFVYKVYALDETRYLFYTRSRTENYYEKDFPADQLVWVEKTKEGVNTVSLTSGDYPIRLVMNQKHPYFTQDGEFYFVFYEGNGTKESLQNGKGYVYHINPKNGVEKIYETKGTYHHFAMDKQNLMVVIEKFELENRNLYPSFFAPYELKYQRYQDKKWTTTKTEQVEPDLEKEYETYTEKQNKK